MQDLIYRLDEHIRHLEGERHPFTRPDGHRRARQYIEQHLGQLGCLWCQPFAARGIEGLNLILKPPGSEDSPQVLIGAHYDSVPGSPGADDNASGVAALLELARLCADSPPARRTWFAAFDLEEWDMLGGKALVSELAKGRQKLDLMVSLEMLGYRSFEPNSQRYPPIIGWFYPKRGDYIGLIGNFKARPLMKQLATCLRDCGTKAETLTVPLRGWLLPTSRWSDHSPFWDYGYPAVMMTDTAWLRNPNYHRPTDTRETLDLEFLAGIVRGLARFLATR